MSVPLLRQPGTSPWQRLHGEDGWIYTREAIAEGRGDVLFRGYAGYLQLPSRAVIGIGTVLTRDELALVVAVLSTLVIGLLALFVYRASEEWIASVPLRITLAAFLCVMPVMGHENTANATNLPWSFAAAVPWALVWFSARRPGLAASAAVVAVGAMATPITLLYVPLAVMRVLTRRNRGTFLVVGAFAVGLAVQAVVVLTSPHGRRWTTHAGDLAELTASRVFASALLGDRGVTGLWDARTVVLTLSVVAVGVAWIVLVRQAPRLHAWVATWFGLLALATFLLPVFLRGTEYLLLFGDARPEGTLRYSVAPIFLLVSSFAVLASPVSERRRPPWRTAAEVVLTAQLVITSIIWFRTEPSDSLEWKAEVESALRACDGSDATDVAVVQLHPIGNEVFFTCEQLERW